MENEMQYIRQDLMKLKREMEIIKRLLISQRRNEDYEEELTDWAKEELEEARNTPESKYVSLEEVKKRIIKK